VRRKDVGPRTYARLVLGADLPVGNRDTVELSLDFANRGWPSGAGRGSTIAPSAYQPFFAASMGVAAALLGLLFVAVSIAPERTVGAGAPVERQVVAESVFTALVNAFFVSMGGAIPDFNIGSVALALSAFALFQTVLAAWRLWPRQFALRLLIQRLVLVVVALAIYGLQFSDAFNLARAPSPGLQIGSEANFLFALYAFALGRSWELLGARRGILPGRSNPTVDADGKPAEPAPPEPAPSEPAPPLMPPLVLTEAPDVAVREGTKNN